MIIIPIHIFLDDKPTKIPKILDEEHTGVKRRNILNSINRGTALSDDSIKSAYLTLSAFCDSSPGLRMVASEEEFSSCLKSMDLLKFFDFFESDSFQYYGKTIKDIFRLDAYLEKEIKKIEGQQPQDAQVNECLKLLSTINFPGTMLKDNLVTGGDNSIQNFQRTVFRLIIDVFFYIVSAWDVTYTQSFLKEVNGDKPALLKVLPFWDGDTLMNPMKLWFEHIQDINGFKTESEFATAIPQLSVSPKDIDPESQKRMLRKWKAGKPKQLPTWENIYSMAEALVRRQKLNVNDWESYKTQAFLIYSHIRIFQILLNRLMMEECRDGLGMNEREVVEFFERYLHWYNYHSVMFMENGR